MQRDKTFKYHTSFILLLLFPALLFSQSHTYKITGKVLDHQTGEPVPFVHVSWAAGKEGTVSNEQGEFVVKIAASSIGDSLSFNCMGYTSYVNVFDEALSRDRSLTVRLLPATYLLATAEVSAVDGKEAVRQAILSIHKNYDTRKYGLQGFLREHVVRKDTREDLLLAEGIMRVYKGTVKRAPSPLQNDLVAIKKGYRKKLNYEIHLNGVTYDLPLITQGAYAAVKLDVIRDPAFLYSSEFIDKCGFEFERKDILKSKTIYVVKFSPKDKEAGPLFQGKLYIEQGSFAIVRATYEYTPEALETFNRNFADAGLTLKERIFDVRYFRKGAKWYLQSAIVRSSYIHEKTSVPLLVSMYYITTIVEDKVKRSTYSKELVISSRAFAFEEILNEVDDDFWGSDNIMLSSSWSYSIDYQTRMSNERTLLDLDKSTQSYSVEDGLTIDCFVEDLEANRFELLIYFQDSILSFPKRITPERINSGKFRFSFKSKQPHFCSLVYENTSFPIFIKPGETITVKVENFNAAGIQMNHISEVSSENQLLLDITNLRQSLQSHVQQVLIEGDASFYLKKVKIYNAACRQFVIRVVQQNGDLDPRLLAWIQDEIRYSTAKMLLTYPMLSSIYNKEELPRDYFQLISEVSINNENAINNPAYLEFLLYHFSYEYSATTKGHPLAAFDVEGKIKLSSELYSGTPLYYVQAQILIDGIQSRYDKIDKLYRKFQKSNAPEELKARLRIAYDYQEYPDFWSLLPTSSLLLPDGDVLDRSYLYGKVVFVDFWATWCQPCRTEIPHSIEMVENYRNEDDLVFLFVSLDRSIDTWKEFVEKKFPKSSKVFHVILESEHANEILDRLGVIGIPRYMILNRQGRIVNNNATRPSQVGTYSEIEKVLKQ
ncbi:MAG: hypothetical protein KatS3mg031_3060 [Chitinophagales bacterium]|nr:MAG: hypothetical protein KatS3mg031_3060 [Chitinophagales bacterium]